MLTKKRPLNKIESNIDANLFQNLLLIKKKNSSAETCTI